MAVNDTTPDGAGASREGGAGRLDTLGARLGLVLVSFVVVATTAVGAFEYARGRRELVSQATSRLESGERLIADRLQRALEQRRRLVAVWPELEAAQDLAVDDVDKRLASSLVRLSESFDGPAEGLGLGLADTVIAASKLRWIGRFAGDRPWADVAPPDTGGAILRLTRDPELGAVVVAAALVRSRSTGRRLGRIVLLTPWSALLEEAAGDDGRALEVHDAAGRLLSRTPPSAGDRLRAPPLRVPVGADTVELSLTAPLDDALLPLRATRRQFALLAFVVLAVTVPSALLIARSNTAALRRLTDSARHVHAGAHVVADFRAPSTAPQEVRVLASALATMVERLEASRVQMARQESLAAMGTMAAVLAHEIRTPLSVLRGSADMLAKRIGDDARDRELVSFVEDEIARLERLVNDLLVFARPRPPEMEDVDLADVAERAVAALGRQADESGVAVATWLNPAPARGDEEQLYQVALNLLSNAMQASASGTEVKVRTGTGPEGARLEVQDQGPGIPADRLEHVWTPFFSTRRGGTGLGLPLVRRIARAHDGDARIETADGRGTTVIMTIPAAKGETA